ncbi:TetR/AcrR family transcriptional regulator [Oceanobacter mangrovi]|uniref:TetR/AcrR family transcriptional regulator n=1 Tax=Oceanobacter mangrovi TaxID=2862510 RepID=UPI001C8E1805|nr:TetR/AcrR family transcriptional regulator [Oceanobacter mangrovi]
MPKKPFSPEEVAYQRERIMNSAAAVMAEQGFHSLSMRKLAAELDMTASNIYNYFPSKESLLLHIRQRGFEMLFHDTNLSLLDSQDAQDALYRLCRQMLEFARQHAGYFQLMFKAPVIRQGPLNQEDATVSMLLDRLVEEWQLHVQSVLTDAVGGMADTAENKRRQVTLYFLSALHGLIDCYHHNSLPLLLQDIDLIPDDMVATYTSWLVDAVKTRVSVGV